MYKATANGSIPQTTISLVQLRAGQIVGNTYHTVRATGDLRKAGETEERITAVASWRDAPYFTDAERVALELVEAVLTPNPSGERVPDELYARASRPLRPQGAVDAHDGDRPDVLLHPGRSHRQADPW